MSDTVLRVADRGSATLPVRQLGELVASWFAPADAADSGGVDLELQPAAGTDIQIDRDGDTLTIRGAVLTVRRAEPAHLAGSRKVYY